jgi:hypothetical protein
VESADGETGADEPIADWFRRTVAEETLPHLRRCLPALTEADCDQDFTQELDWLITGLQTAAAIPPLNSRTADR